VIGKVVTYAVFAALVGLVGIALFRPATLFGVDSKALASSFGGEMQHAEANCIEQPANDWRCAVSSGNFSGAEYMVTTHRFGCWSGSMITAARSGEPAESPVSGCIGLTDLFGR
jgi:hypothetical protein